MHIALTFNSISLSAAARFFKLGATGTVILSKNNYFGASHGEHIIYLNNNPLMFFRIFDASVYLHAIQTYVCVRFTYDSYLIWAW